MKPFNTIHLVFLFITAFFYQCKGKTATSDKEGANTILKDTIKPVVEEKTLKPYNEIVYQSVQKLKSSSGTKSVVFSKNMQSLYAMNLEGMSVCEFSQSTKTISRIFKFRKTPGIGWNYETDKPVKSFEEKPVEAFLSHHDSILWVSLHNAEGVVPIHLLRPNQQKKPLSPTDKLIYLQDPSGKTTDSFYVPLIKTGKTPKVIACTSDDRYLLVSNWHSLDVSVLEINSQTYPYAQLKTNIQVSRIPRGIVIDAKNKKSYVAIMGGSTLSVIDNNSWTTTGEIQVSSNPRHVVQDDKSRLYVSYNKLGKIGCVDPITGETLFTARTASQPRSMALSKNNKFLFVTCYNGNKVMVFKIMEDRFEPVVDITCSGNPVGVDVFENDNKLEVWVCAYETGTISVYTFEKK